MAIFHSKKKNNASVGNSAANEKHSSKEINTKDSQSCSLWEKCPECNEIMYKKDIDSNFRICPKCGYYFSMRAIERINLLIDEGTFTETDAEMSALDPLGFPGYKARLAKAQEDTGSKDAVVSGYGKINGVDVNIAAMDFSFMAGSMGSVVGEKITRAIENGIAQKTPVIVVSSSGGARMHEGIISLMQMAKTSAALERLRENGLPFISIPVNPTTGGVTASFAMLGDVIIAEPKALIGFAGPRVIEQTIKQKLPEGFQRSEFLLEHGMVDVISKRDELKNTVYRVIRNLGFGRRVE